MIKLLLSLLFVILLLGFVLPEDHLMPVQGATARDWNPESFWYYPWGNARVHKGIDIFAKAGTPVYASTGGLVLFSGKISMGGNVVYLLGANWRFHYYAHLQQRNIQPLHFVGAGQQIGTVGSSGNARGKPAHLHYSIKSLFPRIWTYNPGYVKAWNRTFFIDPGRFILRGKA